jgi:hypothetical protein
MSERVESTPVMARKGSFLGTVKAVLWSFVGLRKGSDFEHDSARLNPVHVILVGFGAVLVFVAALIALVNWVVAA